MAENYNNGSISCNRYGYTIGGELYQRVTTIKNMLGKGDILIDWAAAEVSRKVQSLIDRYHAGDYPFEALLMALQSDSLAKAHNETRDKAADFGTAFHSVVEATGSGDWSALKDLPLTPEFWNSVERFKSWTLEFKPTWVEAEVVVFHPELKVAGQLDALAEIQGELWLIDVKTSKEVYKDFALQLAAYKYAPFIANPDGTSRPMPTIHRCGILHVPKSGESCTLNELSVGEPEFAAFKALHSLYWWQRNAAKPAALDPAYDLAFSA